MTQTLYAHMDEKKKKERKEKEKRERKKEDFSNTAKVITKLE
jgi:hypothetical protein